MVYCWWKHWASLRGRGWLERSFIERRLGQAGSSSPFAHKSLIIRFPFLPFCGWICNTHRKALSISACGRKEGCGLGAGGGGVPGRAPRQHTQPPLFCFPFLLVLIFICILFRGNTSNGTVPRDILQTQPSDGGLGWCLWPVRSVWDTHTEQRPMDHDGAAACISPGLWFRTSSLQHLNGALHSVVHQRRRQNVLALCLPPSDGPRYS